MLEYYGKLIILINFYMKQISLFVIIHDENIGIEYKKK